jgi:hypothetical protein
MLLLSNAGAFEPFSITTIPREDLSPRPRQNGVDVYPLVLIHPLLRESSGPYQAVDLQDCRTLVQQVLRDEDVTNRRIFHQARLALGSVADFATCALLSLLAASDADAFQRTLSEVTIAHEDALRVGRPDEYFKSEVLLTSTRISVALLASPWTASAAGIADRLLDYEVPVASSPQVVGRVIRTLLASAIGAQFVFGIGLMAQEEWTHSPPALIIETAAADAGATILLAVGHRFAVQFLDLDDIAERNRRG